MPATIEHLIVLMMENRSFDHIFGYFTVDKPAKPGDAIDGLTGAEFNLNVDGSRVTVSDTARYSGDYRADPGHHFPDVMEQVFGDFPLADPAKEPTMGGFVKDYASQPDVAALTGATKIETAARVMKCFRPSKLPVITGLAQEFAICDRWFSSLPGPTLPNRAFAHCGTSAGHVDMNPVAYWNVPTLYESLDKAGVRSKVYSFDGNTLAFTFKRLFAGGTKFLGQYSDFLDDLDDKLPGYCFIEPRFNDWYDPATHQYFLATDQHPDNNVVDGERFIADVYKAIRASKYWKKCLFVIVYDEHGGFYDHVPPPKAVGVDASPEFDFTRLGVRVPAVLVSPFIKPGTIVHDVFDHTSLAATARALLAPTMKHLSKRSQAANTLDAAFNLSKPRDTAAKSFKAKRETDVNPNTHGTGALTDQQRSQVLAASYVDMTRPAGKRVLGTPEFRTLETINTEQKAAEYIRRVNDSLGNV